VKRIDETHSIDFLRLLELDVVEAAKRLLGATLLADDLSSIIVETEAYRGEDDPACHAFRGVTNRTRIMFESPGFAYVYFSYGCHWMLNVTAHPIGRAAAILIRAAMPVSGLETMRARRGVGARPLSPRDLLSGPGKLAQAYAIDCAQNGQFMFDTSRVLRIEPSCEARTYFSGPRVGIAKGKGDELPWRFIDAEFAAWASRPKLKTSDQK
jgi:DNA-3-methyladenine glycosylase